MSDYIIDESKQFTFHCNGIPYKACVRYYNSGDCDVEIEGDDVNSVVYDAAWVCAERLGLIAEYGDSFDDKSDYGDNT